MAKIWPSNRNHFFFASITLWSLFAICENSHEVLSQSVLSLNLGQEKVLKLRPKRIWIQDKKILKAKSTPQGLSLQGQGVGETFLQWDQNLLRVQVIHPKNHESYKLFNILTQKIPGLNVQWREGRVRVQGALVRWSDWDKLAQQLMDSRAEYVMEAQLAPDLKLEAQAKIGALLKDKGLPPQKLVFGFPIELRLPEKTLKLSNYQQTLRPYGITVIEEKDQIQTQPTIRVQITVAEVHSDQLRQWGVKWPSSLEAQVFPKFGVNQTPLSAQLQALEAKGLGRVLASPNLICQSGKDAEFQAGGEFPIRISNRSGTQVHWKKYGILLRVSPRADSTGRVFLNLETEVSDIASILDGVPSLVVNRVSSAFDLSESRTIVLSGLLKNQSQEARAGLPSLQNIPVLGNLFSSKDYIQKRSELMVFVKPEIVDLQTELPTQPQHLGTESPE